LSNSSPLQTTENTIRHSYQQVRRILDSLFSFVGVLDPDGILIEANRAALEAAGLQAKDVLGKPFSEAYWWSFSAESQHQLQAAIARAAAGENIRYDVLVRLSDDHFITIDFALVPLRDETGRVEYLIPSGIDVTDRKQKEQQLQQLSDLMPQLVWMGNAHGQLDYVNRQWIEYSGLTVEQIHDLEQFAQCHHPQDVPVALSQWAIAQAAKQPFEFEARLQRAVDLTYRWFLVRGVPILDERGQVQRWYGTSTDIHDRKQAQLDEQFLTELDDHLRQLNNADAMQWETVSRLGVYLNVDRVLWSEVDWKTQIVTVHRDWRRDNLPSQAGTYSFTDFISPEQQAAYAAGQPIVISDVKTGRPNTPPLDIYELLEIGALIAVPCMREGQWVAALSVNTIGPRVWRDHEIALTQQVVTRLWLIIEQTRAVQALRESEDRYRIAVASAKLGTWDWDLVNDTLKWDAGCKAMFGLPPDAEITSEKFFNGLHPDDRDRTIEVVQNTLQSDGDGTYDIEYRTIGLEDGVERWVAAKGQAYFSTTGQPLRFIGTVLDITEVKQHEVDRQRAQTQLQDQQERLQAALFAAETGTFRWDIRTNELEWDDNLVRLFGLSPGQTVHSLDAFIQFVHPSDRQGVIDQYAQCATVGADFDMDFRVIHPDGSIHWLSDKGKTFFDEVGNPAYMTGACVDITNRKQAEANLQERNNHIQLLYETTRDLLTTEQPLTLIDALFSKLKSLIGLDVYINYLLDESQQQLYLTAYSGISAETARSIEQLPVGCAVCGTVAQLRSQIVETNVQNSTEPKVQLVRSLGLTAYSCQPLIAQGKLFGTLGFGSCSRSTFTSSETSLFQVIGDQIAIAMERSELVTSLQQQTEELIQSNRLKDEFFSVLSHELRTPLNPILGWTKMLQGQKLSPDKVTQALETIERNVKHQIILVDDLLDVSRVIQGKLRLNFKPVDLAFTLTNAIQTVQFAAQAKSITLRFDHSEPIYTIGDGDRLGQVCWNLLSNAIKFTPEGGQVDVQLLMSNQGTSQSCQIRIVDTGIGISPDFLPHVFESFRQAESGSTRRYNGLGLGLAIVRHLVELHGGTVIAESQGLGQGATFIVKLPLLGRSYEGLRSIDFNQFEPTTFTSQPLSQVDPNSFAATSFVEAQSVMVENSSGQLARVKIVVVDDEPDNLELLRFLLDEEGATVSAFTSPLTALQALAQSPPDLLLSDIGMPEMDGYELIEQVQALFSQQGIQFPAIALTAFAQLSDQQRAIQAGYQAYIAKPIDPTDLIATIVQILA